jgi:hypothetical protein
MSEFRALTQHAPEDNQPVDWITPAGDQVLGGKYCGGLWFLPPDHAAYCYYEPISWRPAR